MVIVLLYLNLVLGEFIATDEWQRIPENEPLPSGLHYRINLETGEKEAKLLDQPESESSEIVPVGEAKDLTPKLMELSDDQKKSLDKINDYLKTVENEKKLNSFDELGVEMVVDFDLMENITRKFVSSDSLLVKLACLEELEFLVHQVDNAADFIKLGGIDLMLDTIVRSNETELHKSAATVLAAAAQGNTAVQVHVTKRNGPKILIDKLYDDSDTSVKKKTLYALSTVVRNFLSAQNAFLKFNGISIFRNLLVNPSLVRNVLTLISDIVGEEKYATKNKNDSKEAHERFLQYKQNNFLAEVKKADWCQAIVSGFDIEVGHHTIIEAILTTISNLDCSISIYHDQLMAEKEKYKFLCDSERSEIDTEDYFCSIFDRINSLLYKTEL